MTEAEWFSTTDSEAIVELLWAKASDRKLRLIACGCCRVVWNELGDHRSREAVEISERFADGRATNEELSRAAYRGEAAVFAVDAWAERYQREQRAIRSGWLPAEDAVEVPSMPSPERARVELRRARLLAEAAENAAGDVSSFLQEADCSLIDLVVVRCVVANPFRPATFDANWRTTTAIQLAQQMYESRDFSVMPILADALRDAGCDHADILDHCRGPGPHVRGCWVVDLVLGKE